MLVLFKKRYERCQFTGRNKFLFVAYRYRGWPDEISAILILKEFEYARLENDQIQIGRPLKSYARLEHHKKNIFI